MKAQKKPVIIDYFEISEIDLKNFDDFKLKLFVESFGDKFEDHFDNMQANSYLKVKTLEGTSYEVTDKDVIIRGVKGEYYPCKRDIFDETYMKIKDNIPYTT